MKNDSLSDLLSLQDRIPWNIFTSGITCSIDSPDIFPASFVTGEFRRNIFLSVKEILHNIVKHAQANHVDITIQINRSLCIDIRDDGVGFDQARIRPYSNGLMNIRKRMKDIGGIVEIENINGTIVKLIVPFT
jgi:signal transduction histidine kinase